VRFYLLGFIKVKIFAGHVGPAVTGRLQLSCETKHLLISVSVERLHVCRLRGHFGLIEVRLFRYRASQLRWSLAHRLRRRALPGALLQMWGTVRATPTFDILQISGRISHRRIGVVRLCFFRSAEIQFVHGRVAPRRSRPIAYLGRGCRILNRSNSGLRCQCSTTLSGLELNRHSAWAGHFRQLHWLTNVVYFATLTLPHLTVDLRSIQLSRLGVCRFLFRVFVVEVKTVQSRVAPAIVSAGRSTGCGEWSRSAASLRKLRVRRRLALKPLRRFIRTPSRRLRHIVRHISTANQRRVHRRCGLLGDRFNFWYLHSTCRGETRFSCQLVHV
jgi:hypothetical protein